MHSRSRRRRDRDRRHAIFQAQAQSYELKRFLWHRPRDDVAGATGQGDVQCVALIGALFFKKMAVSVALNGAGCAGSVALLHYLVPARIPYKSREKHVF